MSKFGVMVMGPAGAGKVGLEPLIILLVFLIPPCLLCLCDSVPAR